MSSPSMQAGLGEPMAIVQKKQLSDAAIENLENRYESHIPQGGTLVIAQSDLSDVGYTAR